MEVKIIKFDHFGRGIGYINDKVVFVNKTLPGEIVDIKVIKEKSKYLEGKIVKIKEKSTDRIESICPYYNECGGCDLLHTNYKMEKKFKIDKCIELLGKCDNFYETNNLNYRNKVTLHIKNNKIGFYKDNTHELVSINYCYLLDDKINKVINDLNEIDKNKINKIIIKCHNNKLLLDVVGIVSNDFINYFDYVETIIINNKILKGKGFLEESIFGKKFIVTSEAFFQVNKYGLININNIIERYLKGKNINKVLDLYSGTGLWGILISDYVKDIICIEINKEACRNANINIKNNNIDNIKIINGKVSDYIDSFNNIDLVITDPPRSGLDTKTINYLKKINSKYFIYISCDMYTLKRDLKELDNIYEIKEINLVDMFRGTYHCEVVTILERKID